MWASGLGEAWSSGAVMWTRVVASGPPLHLFTVNSEQFTMNITQYLRITRQLQVQLEIPDTGSIVSILNFKAYLITRDAEPILHLRPRGRGLNRTAQEHLWWRNQFHRVPE